VQCGRDFQTYLNWEPPLTLCPSCERELLEAEQRAAEAYDDPDPIIDERTYP
jgi:hypothetical protein